MRRQHNPAHAGEVLREWLPEDMTVTQAAKTRNMTPVEIHAAQLLEAIVFYATYDPGYSHDDVTPQELHDD